MNAGAAAGFIVHSTSGQRSAGTVGTIALGIRASCSARHVA
ncbi:MAG TPA: hypothetical protein VF526_22225 [Solirubrobacteraceae bacterium]